MGLEDHKDLVRKYQEAFNHGDLAALDGPVAADLATRSQAPGPAGGAGGKTAHRGTVGAFPDLHYAMDELIAEGDTVVERFKIAGTHRGPFMGIPPTGRPIRSSGVSFYRVRGGKIVEHWGLQDGLTLMTQLGVFTPPGGVSQTQPPSSDRTKTPIAIS